MEILRLQALANYVTFDNAELVKRCLYLFAAMNTTEGKIPANVFVKPSCLPDDTFLFDYSLFFISVLYDYEMAHEDMKFLKVSVSGGKGADGLLAFYGR